METFMVVDVLAYDTAGYKGTVTRMDHIGIYIRWEYTSHYELLYEYNINNNTVDSPYIIIVPDSTLTRLVFGEGRL